MAAGGALAVLPILVLLGCSTTTACPQPPVEDGDCPDLVFSEDSYDEWRPVPMPDVTEELGDGRYPACNDDEPCNGPDLDGFGATDVWRLAGVEPRDALIGWRQGSRTSVIFLRQGLDPASVPGLTAYESAGE